MKKEIYVDRKHDRLLDFDYTNSVVVDRLKLAVLKSVEIYYATHTARETCDMFGIPFTPEHVKALHQLWPKNMGLGGARQGAGQKKKP